MVKQNISEKALLSGNEALAQAKINILDAYGFVIQPNNFGICCMEIESLQLSGASEIVKKAGFEILECDQLYDI